MPKQGNFETEYSRLARYTSSMTTISSFFFLGLGFFSAILFYAEIYVPVWFSALLMVLVVFYYLGLFRTKKAGILMGVLLMVYLLPFIHIPPYAWYDFSKADPLIGFGRLRANTYMFDETIIRLTAMIGATGALGFGLGLALNRKFVARESDIFSNSMRPSLRTLSTPVWFLWIIIGLLLSLISARPETIIDEIQPFSSSISETINFSSAWMISYIILIFTCVDAAIEPKAMRRQFKISVLILVVAYIVIWLQLLRGDREAIPWLFALSLIFLYWTSAYNQQVKIIKFRWLKIGLGAFLLVFISMIIGFVRADLRGSNLIDAVVLTHSIFYEDGFRFDGLLFGTWSAVLLTPLSVAGDYVSDLSTISWGRGYIDIFLSLPPGFVADLLGYERPLRSSAGPAYEMKYGQGGTHAVVLPFLNFSIIGVFLIPAFWSYFFTSCEKLALRKPSVVSLSFLATVVMASPHWLWYGEKSCINALIIWVFIAFCFRLSPTNTRFNTNPREYFKF